MAETPDPADQPPEPSPDDPFMPIVESLLKYPIGSPEFEDAARVASPLERAEVLRQVEQQRGWLLEHQGEARQRLDYLEAEFGLGDEQED